MRFQFLSTLACLAVSSALPTQDFGQDAAPELRGKRSFVKRGDGVEHTIFEHEATGAKLDFVTNSGICETTPGVNQYSGYLSVGSKLPLRLCIQKLFSDIEIQAMKICGSGFSRPEIILPRPLWQLGSMEDQAALP